MKQTVSRTLFSVCQQLRTVMLLVITKQGIIRKSRAQTFFLPPSHFILERNAGTDEEHLALGHFIGHNIRV